MKESFLHGSVMAALLLSAVASPLNQRRSCDPILGNYPDASIPLSSNTAITPDAPPTNTTTINVSTSTNFNGRLEGDPVTGVVRTTDAHPAGTYPVTMKGFASDGTSTMGTFTLTVTTPATCNPVSFAAATSYMVGIHPYAVAVGDFNRDGYQDLAVANLDSNNVSILLGNGDGTFQPAVNYTVGSYPTAVAVGDFNGDGNQDLAVTNSTNLGPVSILLGNGDGTFGTATNFVAGGGSNGVVVGDFNGDGNQDLALTSDDPSSHLSILLGDGNGNFGGPTNFNTGGIFPDSIAVGDFNGDGNQDLAVANAFMGGVSILLGDGTGNFCAPSIFVGDSGANSVAVGDFNGDGNQDLAVATASNNISILLGDGAGHFSAPTTFPTGSSPQSVAVGDFNGDGYQDLAIANYLSDNVSILLGHGDGTFSPPTNFGAGNGPNSVAVGDFNGDGSQDLAVVNNESMSILLRDCALTPTGIVSRKTHSGAGNFDINLPLTGNPGIECRSTGGTKDYTIIATFSDAVTVNGNPQAQVTLGTGTVGSGGVSNGGMVIISGNTVSIPLTNVANAQTINVTLFGVNGVGNVVVPMTVLTGDVNGNGAVSATDVAVAKSGSGQPVDATNFRADVNANGVISAADVSIIKLNIGNEISP